MNIKELLSWAKKSGASDLHISAEIPPKCRINGEICNVNNEVLKVDDTKKLAEEILPERLREYFDDNGEVDFSYETEELGRFRVNVFKQRGTISMVIRIINDRIPSLVELGLPQSVVELTKKKRGLVLVTGPTGSGKSTTLAALIDEINKKYNKHIITLEDPIEYLHKHNKSIVNQREIGVDTNSYAGALRAALREDPDIILVGEMRDLDTIATAITAAETGHLVFATLHTIGAVPTIERIIDVFPTYQQPQIRTQLATLLEAVISQQLLPTLMQDDRVAAFEVMLASSAIRNLIRESKIHQIPSVMQMSKQQGMITMDDALYNLFARNIIAKDDAICFAQDKENFSNRLF